MQQYSQSPTPVDPEGKYRDGFAIFLGLAGGLAILDCLIVFARQLLPLDLLMYQILSVLSALAILAAGVLLVVASFKFRGSNWRTLLLLSSILLVVVRLVSFLLYSPVLHPPTWTM